MSPRRGFRAMVTEAVWAELLALGTPHRFRPRAELVRQGGFGEFLFAVAEGRIKVLHRNEDGEQLLMAIRGPGCPSGRGCPSPSRSWPPSSASPAARSPR
ncbi:hypothetical protein [Crossiella sp. NPDC003009]